MNIAVVGSGMTGVSAALRLSQKGHIVTIYEKDSCAGGLASSVEVGNEDLDRFYHHIFTSDNYIIDLIEEMGISESLKWYEPKNAIYLDNTLYPFTSPLDLIRFRPVSFISRIKMGLLVLTAKLIKDYTPFESITALEWIRKRSGKDACEKVWEPLLKSKFDIDSNVVSGTWIWNKFKLRGSSRGKNIAKEMLGYLDGGFILLIDKILNEIARLGGKILYNSEVKSISKTDKGLLELESSTGKAFYDKILFTHAPEKLSDIYKGYSPNYSTKLNEIKYKANLCLMLELSESLSPYYWITISQKGFPFVLIIEHTNLVGLKGYNSHVVYLSRYLDANDSLFTACDESIINEFINHLNRVFPYFNENSIKKATLSRAKYSQPVTTLEYGKRIPDIKTPVKGLFLASMPQIYPEDRGLNYAVGLGKEAANVMLESL